MNSKEIEILNGSLNVLIEVIGNINAQIKALEPLTPTRNVSIARTKLEEAAMWLEKEQADLSVMLARATCR